MKIYIAGRMTGLPEYNFPAFDHAADSLISMGHSIISPAHLSRALSIETKRDLATIPQTEYMLHDLRALLNCDAIAMLDGWWYSQGATMEFQVAKSAGLCVYRFSDQIAGFLDSENYCPPNLLAEKLIRETIKSGLSKHGAESWQNEPHFNHLLKASRHAITHELQRTGWSPVDGECHAANAVTRAAMALWQSIYSASN